MLVEDGIDRMTDDPRMFLSVPILFTIIHHDVGINLSPNSSARPFPTFLATPLTSPPLCMLELVIGGGTKASKFRPLRAALAAAGVLLSPGVLPPHGAWAGDGVTLTKSAKLNCCPGVEKRGRLVVEFEVGVERKEEGRAGAGVVLEVAVVVVIEVCWEGGVEGGSRWPLCREE